MDMTTTVVYTDGSRKKNRIGWAWCANDERHGSGSLVRAGAKNVFDSMLAEIMSVLKAVEAISSGRIVVVNDNAAVVNFINNKRSKKKKNSKSKTEKANPDLYQELRSQIAQRCLIAVLPKNKNKGRHGWCDKTAWERSSNRPLTRRPPDISDNDIVLETYNERHQDPAEYGTPHQDHRGAVPLPP